MKKGGEDKEKLLADFNTQLAALEDDLASDSKKEGAVDPRQKGAIPPTGEAAPPEAPSAEEIAPRLHLHDTFTIYEELKLPDGRILRRYDTGAVRVENPKSGVIQEERLDGSLLVSLPNGTVIFQEFRGEPLLVYNIDRKRRPSLARVSSATLPGETTPKFVFFFQDEDGTHLVELGTLRYYKVRPPAKQGG